MLQGLLARLKEPSSYAGLSVLLGLFGVHLAPEKFTAIIGIATAVAGALAIFLPEGTKPTA